MSNPGNTLYLDPTYYLDFTEAVVQEFGNQVCRGANSDKERAIRLYYAVRDEIRYDPYDIQRKKDTFKASSVLKKGSGFCVVKAVALTALGRQQGIPSRLGFADVRNHLSTSRLSRLMETDTFYYHGYTEFLLEGCWVKATPAFNLELCERFQVKPLEFDGLHNSLFHEFKKTGEKHMEYLHDHGPYPDLPFEEIFHCYFKQYPKMFSDPQYRPDGADFHREVQTENR